MILLNDYEQEITSMLVASDKDMQQHILSQLSKKMFTNRLYAKIFDIAELLFNSGKEVNVYSIVEKLSNNEDKQILFSFKRILLLILTTNSILTKFMKLILIELQRTQVLSAKLKRYKRKKKNILIPQYYWI